MKIIGKSLFGLIIGILFIVIIVFCYVFAGLLGDCIKNHGCEIYGDPMTFDEFCKLNSKDRSKIYDYWRKIITDSVRSGIMWFECKEVV